MKLWFVKRGYPKNIIDEDIGKVKISKSSQKTNKGDKIVRLFVRVSHITKKHRQDFS